MGVSGSADDVENSPRAVAGYRAELESPTAIFSMELTVVPAGCWDAIMTLYGSLPEKRLIGIYIWMTMCSRYSGC